MGVLSLRYFFLGFFFPLSFEINLLILYFFLIREVFE